MQPICRQNASSWQPFRKQNAGSWQPVDNQIAIDGKSPIKHLAL